MSDLVTLSKDGDVAVVTINNPPVNALSPGVPEGVIAHVQAAADVTAGHFPALVRHLHSQAGHSCTVGCSTSLMSWVRVCRRKGPWFLPPFAGEAR